MRSLRWITLGALTLGAAGCSMFDNTPDEARWPLEQLTGNTAARAARRMEDKTFPDERREGMLYLVDHRWGRRGVYTERYAQIARYDADYTVRAMAVRALNISRDPSAIPIFINALTDPAPLVRLEAAKALSNLPDPAAAPGLLALVADEGQARDVRIAAADALRHYKSLDVARNLVNQLPARDFAVAWQSLRSLVALSGKDFGYDQGAWLAYLTGPEHPLS